MNIKTIAKIGLLICFFYFIVVVLLILIGNNITILLMDIITLISGIYMILLVISFPIDNVNKNKIIRLLAIIFVSSCMILTNIVHWINILLILPMINNGINIPDYLQIGKWPSVLMAMDYIGWGLFMGLAYILSGIFTNLKFKWLLYLFGSLCIIGFFGIIVNVNLWYIAPFGYGIGTAIICIKILIKNKNNDVRANCI